MLTQHNCRTTFAGGVNPFLLAMPFMPQTKPSKTVQRSMSKRELEDKIFKLLGDGIRRNLHEIQERTGGTPNALGYSLGMMARAMTIRRAMRPSHKGGVRPVPEFWREV